MLSVRSTEENELSYCEPVKSKQAPIPTSVKRVVGATDTLGFELGCDDGCDDGTAEILGFSLGCDDGG